MQSDVARINLRRINSLCWESGQTDCIPGCEVCGRWIGTPTKFTTYGCWLDSRQWRCSARAPGLTCGSRADGCVDRTRCSRWAPRNARKDGHPLGAQLDILGDRMIETCSSRISLLSNGFALAPVLFFARGAATDFLRGLALKAGHPAGGECDVANPLGRALVLRAWSRGLYAAAQVRVLLLPRTRTGADARPSLCWAPSPAKRI